jgi:fructose-1-phosphate kinase PfkB-like protein
MADRLAERILGQWTWTDGETRSCFAIHEVRDGTITELNEAGHSSGRRRGRSRDRLLGRADRRRVGVATISGTSPGAPIDGLRQLASVGAALGGPVALDAGGEVLRLALDARPWLVKINAQEANATLDKASGSGDGPDGPATDPIDDEAAAIASGRALAAWTGGAVIVTRGRAGAIAVGPDGQTYRVGRPNPEGSYPVGSGDAFLAGVTVATIDGRGFDAALRLRAATAIANAQVRGAARSGRGRPDRARIVVEPIVG